MAFQSSRRDFLKLSLLSLGSMAFKVDFPPDRVQYHPGTIGRVAYHSISVLDAPRLDANTVNYYFRDELINIYKQVTPPDGPAYNPLWFRVWDGYVHSAYVQLVDVQINPVQELITPGGLLCDLTVPYSQPYEYSQQAGWLPKEDFRLYYGSTHWVTDLVEGPDKEPWYMISDELWDGFNYYVPAGHLRLIPAEELAPISPEVAPEDKRIEVNLQQQILTAYEADQIVLRTNVSTGVTSAKPVNGYPTETPTGHHFITSKMPSKHMGSSRLTDNLEDRALPGVPWTSFFAEGGYALHGAYWHNNFGLPMSRGCINIRNEQAKWLFRWTNPVWNPQVDDQSDWEVRGFGTQVDVI